MCRNAGYLVETNSGKGRTYHSEQMVNGKIVVHLLSEDLNHVIQGNGQPKKILCDRNKVKLIGYVD